MKKYRRVMYHDTEKWCKIWKKTLTLGSKNDLRDLVNFNATSDKKIQFEPKKYRGLMCHKTEELCIIWGGTDLYFEKWHEEFGEFWPNTRKSQNLHFNGLLLTKVCNGWAKKVQKSSVSWYWRVI